MQVCSRCHKEIVYNDECINGFQKTCPMCVLIYTYNDEKAEMNIEIEALQNEIEDLKEMNDELKDKIDILIIEAEEYEAKIIELENRIE
jgi:predicted RNase H-like nuclease (RuvC/YqgF family)